MKSGIRVLCFIFIFSVFSVCFALNRCVNTNESVVNDVASDVLTIVIDAGHGGQDPGAVEGNVREADINLDIAQRLRDKLTSKGFNVVMTRETDDGAINPAIMVIIIGKRIRVRFETSLGSYGIRIMRSFFVVRSFITGG